MSSFHIYHSKRKKKEGRKKKSQILSNIIIFIIYRQTYESNLIVSTGTNSYLSLNIPQNMYLTSFSIWFKTFESYQNFQVLYN